MLKLDRFPEVLKCDQTTHVHGELPRYWAEAFVKEAFHNYRTTNCKMASSVTTWGPQSSELYRATSLDLSVSFHL